MAEGIDLDAALDELYRTPPEGFTAARNALVKALRADKRRDEAESVSSLRKPGRLVWALNQLGLEGDDALEPMLEAADLVREGGGEDLREAIAELRDAVGEAAAAAARRLDPVRTTDKADLTQSLLAIVADEDAVADLETGRLEDIPEPDAFGLGPSMPTAAPKPKPARKKPVKQPEGAERPPDQLAIRRATKRHKEAAKANDAAERALARAEKAVDDEADDLAQADADLADAKEAVDTAEAALAEARSQLEEAEAAAAKAVDDQERAAAQLAEARARAEETAEELEAAQAELDEVGG